MGLWGGGFNRAARSSGLNAWKRGLAPTLYATSVTY
jgi:hypothetical protein